MIPILVEGDTDVPIARRLLELVDFEVGSVYGLRGKNWLDGRLHAYNAAAYSGVRMLAVPVSAGSWSVLQLIARLLSLTPFSFEQGGRRRVMRVG